VSTFAPIRWTTVHPFLVHLTLGVLPVVLVAYAVAWARRSERWSFAGDVALWIGAASAVVTLAFGLVSNALVPWPGGIELWRWLHLGFGVAATLLLLTLAAVRLRAQGRGVVAGPRTLLAAAAVAIVVGATGWIGGEVLVFHSGMAVAAAGQGALAPAITLGGGAPPDFEDAMGAVRGAWAEATTQYDLMLVTRPTDAGYARIAAAARRLGELAAWVEKDGPAALARERGSAAKGGAGEKEAAPIVEMGGRLEQAARELEQAARARQWAGVAQGMATVTTTCAGCHLAVRWAE
jgi:uncharacterized membrane protein